MRDGYLTRSAITATLRFIATLPAGTTVVFDYAEPPSQRDPASAAAHKALAKRVSAAGEPLRSYFAPDDLVRDVKAAGFSDVENFDATKLNAWYFAGRTDGFRVRAGHLMRARV